MSRVLVTGGSGFLAASIVPLLSQRHEVIATDRETMDVTDALAVQRAVRAIRPDLVCHLAALCGAEPSRAQPLEFYTVNTLGTLHLLEACRRAGVPRFLFTSSLTVHGAGAGPVDESSPPAPRHPYAASKAAAECAVRDYSEHLGLRSIILRPTLVVGEASKELHALGDFVLKALRNEEIILFNAGEHRRDFIHPADVAAAAQLALERLLRDEVAIWEAFNISLGEAPSMRELADLVIRIVGSGRHAPGPSTNQAFSLYTSIEQARKVLGFEPHVGLEAMIGRMVRYFRETKPHELPPNDPGDHHHQRAPSARGLRRELRAVRTSS